MDERHWIIDLIVYTRHWIHYGALAFVFIVTIAAAAEGLAR